MDKSGLFLPLLLDWRLWLLLLLLYVGVYYWQWWQSGCPPGPVPVPILGNLVQVDFARIHLYVTKLHQIYGDIICLHMGEDQKFVYLGSPELVQEAFTKQARICSGRLQPIPVEDFRQGRGIISAEGLQWKERRYFLVESMREMSKSKGEHSFEEAVLTEAKDMTVKLTEFCDSDELAAPIKKMLFMSSAKVMKSMLFGKDVHCSDHELWSAIGYIEREVKAAPRAGIVGFFKFLKLIPGDWFGYKDTQRELNGLQQWICEKLSNEAVVSKRLQCTSTLATRFREMGKTQDGDPDSSFSEPRFQHTMSETFVAGVHTTGSTLHWAVLYMCVYPNIQQKVRQEIHRVIGKDKAPCWKDRDKLPYMEACIMEIERCAPVVPFAVPHRNRVPTTIGGFHIPRDSVIVSNIWKIHYDRPYWSNPEQFNPERFLMDNGTVRQYNKYFMPFGKGARVCPGESLARMEVFLLFVSLLQKFEFGFTSGEKPSSLDGYMGIGLFPPEFDCKVKRC